MSISRIGLGQVIIRPIPPFRLTSPSGRFAADRATPSTGWDSTTYRRS